MNETAEYELFPTSPDPVREVIVTRPERNEQWISEPIFIDEKRDRNHGPLIVTKRVEVYGPMGIGMTSDGTIRLTAGRLYLFFQPNLSCLIVRSREPCPNGPVPDPGPTADKG